MRKRLLPVIQRLLSRQGPSESTRSEPESRRQSLYLTVTATGPASTVARPGPGPDSRAAPETRHQQVALCVNLRNENGLCVTLYEYVNVSKYEYVNVSTAADRTACTPSLELGE